jgi:hypothetical protein
MPRSRLPLILALVTLPILACTKGDECDTCSSDADCKSGFVCSSFLNPDGTVNSKRCGTGVGASTCRVR